MHAERLSARGEYGHARATSEQIGNDVADWRDQVLAVVDQEQQLALADRGTEVVGRDIGQPEPARDLLGDSHLIGDRREVDEPDAFVEARALFGRDAQRDARLACAARARDCGESRLAKQCIDLCDFAVASDERARLRGKVVPATALRTWWWKPGGKFLVGEFE